MSKPFNLKDKKQNSSEKSKTQITSTAPKELRACFNGWKGQAKRRGKKFNLTYQEIQQIWLAQNGHCKVSGQVMTFKMKDANKVSLDRIDPKRDYSFDNVRMVTVKVNYVRHIYSDDDLRAILKDMEYIDSLRKSLGGSNWFKRLKQQQYKNIYGRKHPNVR